MPAIPAVTSASPTLSLAARLPERPLAVIYSESTVRNKFTAVAFASDMNCTNGRASGIRIDTYAGFDQALAGVRQQIEQCPPTRGRNA